MSLLHTDLTGLLQLEKENSDRLKSQGQLVKIPEGTVVFRPGTACTNFYWLLQGCLRVQMVGDTGREIVLYRVTPGETCIITTSCLMSGTDYNAEAIAETDTKAMAIPREVFNDLLAQSALFREKIFEFFGGRLGILLSYVEEITFGKLDVRLARYLLDHQVGDHIGITHENLARELGTHREVVSRLLKEFERRDWVKLGRGQITLIDHSALHQVLHSRVL